MMARARLAVSAAGWWLRQWYHAARAQGADPEDRHRYAWGACSGIALVRWRRALGRDTAPSDPDNLLMDERMRHALPPPHVREPMP